MAWSLTEMKRLALYYDSVQGLGQLACFQWFYFASSGGQSRIECVGLSSFLGGENQKAITRLKSFGSS